MTVDSVPPFGEVVGAPTAAPSPRPRRGAADKGIALTGELLITAGVVLGLYVLWQLFYTDVQSERTQSAALEQVVFPEPAATPALTSSGAGAGEAGETSTPLEMIPDDLKVYSPAGAPVMAEPAEATTFAALWVPRWGSDYIKPVSEGTDRHTTLDRLGIGHYTDTAMPGEVGNFAIAGHRTTYGKPFTDINTLEVGDALVVQTDGAWYVYRVTSTQIVQPEQVEVIAPVPNQPGTAPTVASITLTSCHPRYSAEQRYIVHGELEYWAPAGHGYPQEVFDQS